MYKELQKLRNRSRKNYNFDIHSASNSDVENYITFSGQITPNPYVPLLDSASILIILTNPKFFNFLARQTSW